MDHSRTLPFDAEIALDEIISSAQSQAQTALQLEPRSKRMITAPVFVVGSPRSGTTVLGRCLGNHLQCSTAEESLILLPLWRIYVDLYAGGIPSGVAHLSEYTDANTLVQALGELADVTFSGLLARHGTAIYVDHTPWYGAIAPFVKALYPDARFIHIIRDGRQVTRSLQDSYDKGFRWAGANLPDRIRIWSDMVTGTSKLLQHYPEDTYTVHYQSLTRSPEATLRGITDFLQLPFAAEVLEPLRTKFAASDVTTSFGAQGFQERFTSSGWPRNWTDTDYEQFISLGSKTMDTHFSTNWKQRPQ